MRVLGLLAVSMVLVPTPGVAARAQTASFVGKWHWNKDASTSIPGEPAPRDILLNITDLSDAALEWTLTEIDPQGGTHAESFNGKPDGAPASVSGAGEQTTAAFTVAGNTLNAVFKSQDGSGDTWSCMLSPDGGKMNCKSTESDGKGHSADYTDVYDRL